MANYQIDVDGTTISDLIDVSYSKSTGGDIGQAAITVVNDADNRALFASGADVTIRREDVANPGTYDVEWTGEVIGKPSNTSARNLTLLVEAETKLGQLEFGKVARPFIELDTGEIIRRMITRVKTPNTLTKFITTGSSITDWESDANVFQKANINDKRLHEFGSNLLYAEFKEDTEGEWRITNYDLSGYDIRSRAILSVDMRMLVNNRGTVFSNAELELRDSDGIGYVWDLDIPGYAGFKDYQLAVEDADVGEQAGRLRGLVEGTRAIELRFDNDGGLPEDRALAIDMIRANQFQSTFRDTSLSVAGVEDTGRTITRRLNGSIFYIMNQLATDDGAIVYVDDDEVVHYETAGGTPVDPELNIDDETTPVVDVDVDRDYSTIRNRVTIQGNNDLQGYYEDSASIEFYNIEAPREEPIVDTSIRTRDGLQARGRGFLNENAWEDTAMSFTIASSKYKDVRIGRAIDVEWSPEGISGTFVVSSIQTTPEGYTTIGLTGNTSI